MKEKPSVLTPLSTNTMKGMRENMAKRKPVPPKKTVLEFKGEQVELKPPKKIKVDVNKTVVGESPAYKQQVEDKKEVKRPKEFPLTVKVYQKAKASVEHHDRGMTVEEAKAMIGWTVVGPSSKGQKGTGDSYTGPFHLRDMSGNKVLLERNATNRPFRVGLAKRYMNEILRRKWALNGETFVFDWKDDAQSAQHRLAGFILAEEARLLGAKGNQSYAWISRYWKGPLFIECIVVQGIDDDPHVVDTLDQGQKRTHGDVIYRAEVFGTPQDIGPLGDNKVIASDKVMKKLANILAGAARLVWLRAGGKRVSNAPHFPVSEMMEFISSHDKLKDIVLAVYNLDGGQTSLGGSKITRYLPMGYAAGLWYLMAVCGTDPEAYELGVKDGRGVENLDFSMEPKAKLFWERLAGGLGMSDGDPIHVCRELLRGMDKGSAEDRDEVVAMIIKAFNLWLDGVDKKGDYKGNKVSAKDLRVKRTPDDQGKMKLAEDPRLGGMDIEGNDEESEAADDFVDDVPEGDQRASSGKKEKKPKAGKGSGGAKEEKYRPEQDEREGSKEGKQWAEGDTAWVKPQKGSSDTPYFGTIGDVFPAIGKPGRADFIDAHVYITDDNGEEWDEPVSRLSLKYPG